MATRQKHGWEAASFKATMTILAMLALILLIAPTLVVLIVSLTSSFFLRFPPPGYSFRWYVALLDAWQLHFAAWNSVKVAAWTTLLSVVLGVAASPGISRSPTRTGKVLDSLFMSPLTLVLGHTIVGVPYVVRNTVAALAQLDPALMEASASLGAGRWFTCRRIVPPLVRPGVIAGGFICFMSSFDNVPVSLFLRDAATDMLPIRMWQDLEGRLDVTIAALSGVLIVTTSALLLVMERFTGL